MCVQITRKLHRAWQKAFPLWGRIALLSGVCLLSTTRPPVAFTCTSAFVRLGQRALGTQRELNGQQIVCLPHRWRAPALFARRIRHTVGWAPLAERNGRNVYPFGDGLPPTSDTLEMWFVWIARYLKNRNIARASCNQALFFFSFFFLKWDGSYSWTIIYHPAAWPQVSECQTRGDVEEKDTTEREKCIGSVTVRHISLIPNMLHTFFTRSGVALIDRCCPV